MTVLEYEEEDDFCDAVVCVWMTHPYTADDIHMHPFAEELLKEVG